MVPGPVAERTGRSIPISVKRLIHLIATAGLAIGGVTAAPGPLQDKTLVAWVYLADTNQQGGSTLTLMEGEDFDAIVFGERQPGR
jgi:hypothetical protein